MTNEDEEILRTINLAIGVEEHKGSWEALSKRLATEQLRAGGETAVLAFRRAGGACIDARSYLDGVAESPERSTVITSIQAEGQCRAIVRCVVEMGGKKYDNLRVFVRSSEASSDWRLLAWANEPRQDGEAPRG